ncbi:ankyrin repeat-containing domain protein [Podospora didyma]|uniref:Ankyrin repeat-containing domain protein n=1 Tax=Podospora didyma TaxID=330526 RepID=A0AAE0TVK6_9PEZI|nr:ankyrin repeat-containing domain protein [Podospora didyma]
MTETTLLEIKQQTWGPSQYEGPPPMTRSASEEALARMGWKPVASADRPRQRECQEVVKANRTVPQPTPSVWVHGVRCTCKEVEDNQRIADDTLALKILAAVEIHRSRKKADSGISMVLPNPKLGLIRRGSLRHSGITMVMQKRVSRMFAATPPTPSIPTVADLCLGCSELDIAKVVRYLFDEGVPVNVHNHLGITPLMAAVRATNPHLRPKSHLAMITLLLDCGADPNASTAAQAPPGTSTASVLTTACSLDLPDVVRLLLDRGAAVDAPLPAVLRSRLGNRGLRALHVATLADKPECVEVLLSHGGANVAATVDARRSVHRGPDIPNDRPSSKPLKRRSSDDDDNDHWTTGISPLHLAHASPSCTAILLRHGAKPLARDGYGRTPLHWAASAISSGGHADVVELLLAAGTNADALDQDGATPLSMLISRVEADGDVRNTYKEDEDAEIARALLTAGADPDLKVPESRRSTLRARVARLDRRRRGRLGYVFDEFETEVFDKKVL